MLIGCAHCGLLFNCNNLRRKYCCNSCNVLASYARNGRPAERDARLAEAKKQLVAVTKKRAAAREKNSRATGR